MSDRPWAGRNAPAQRRFNPLAKSTRELVSLDADQRRVIREALRREGTNDSDRKIADDLLRDKFKT